MKTQRKGVTVSDERQRLDVASEVDEVLSDSSTSTSPSPSPFEQVNVNPIVGGTGPPTQDPPEQQLPMSQLPGPSPHPQHLTRGMHPLQGPGPGSGYPPTAPSQFRSPNRAGTSGQGQGGMLHPSSSIAPRQPPGTWGMTAAENGINAELMHMPRSLLQQLKQEAGFATKDLSSLMLLDKQRILKLYRQRKSRGPPPPERGRGGVLHLSPSMAPRQPPGMTAAEYTMNAELMHMPQSLLQQLKQEAGLATKDDSSLMLLDKQRILSLYQQRKSRGQPPPNNATPGSSNPMMRPPNPVRNKRSSTSPGEEHANIPRNESSPPGIPSAGGTGPPTPAPGPQRKQNPGLGQARGQIAPSPSSLLGVGPDPLSSNIFSTDFIQSVASSLDEYDPGIFRPDGDINFERDFGQWFNQDGMGGGQQQHNPGPRQAQGQISPSPSLLLPDPLSSNIFSTDFIQSVARSLDDFDPGIFRPDGDIDFERDFGQWFNQDAMGGGSLDSMK